MGTAIVLITHDLGAVADIADTWRCSMPGAASSRARPTRSCAAAEHPYTRGLMGCNAAPPPRCGSGSPRRAPCGKFPASCLPSAAAGDLRLRGSLPPRRLNLPRPAPTCPVRTGPRAGGCLLAPGDPRGMNAHSPLPPPAADLLRIEDLTVHFPVPGRSGSVVHAVDGVSFTVRRGRASASSAESGSGKSTRRRA